MVRTENVYKKRITELLLLIIPKSNRTDKVPTASQVCSTSLICPDVYSCKATT